MPILQLIKISLSTKDATYFKLCQKYYDQIKILAEDGFFDLKNCRYEINKDSTGTIRETKFHKVGYKYSKGRIINQGK